MISYGTSVYRVCNFVQFKSAGEIKTMAMKIPKGASGQVIMQQIHKEGKPGGEALGTFLGLGRNIMVFMAF